MTLGRTRRHYVSQTSKSSQSMFCIVVVPRHAIVIEESEQFIPVLFNSPLERKPGLCCAFHGDDVLDESSGRSSVLAQMSRLQAVRVYSLDDLSKQRPNRSAISFNSSSKGFLCKSSLMSRIKWIRHFC